MAQPVDDVPEGGPAWELLLDRRLPPSRRVPDAVVQSARSLRRANPTINCASALSLLKAEFGDGLEVSSTWLKRVWAQAGLSRAPSSGRRPEGGGVVEVLHGGGGLALIAAADAELKASTQLAEAVLGAAQEASAAQGEVTPRDEGEGARDDHGRFTAAYNHGWREGVAEGARDGRLAPDKKKRKQRELRTLPTASLRPETLAQKHSPNSPTAPPSSRRRSTGTPKTNAAPRPRSPHVGSVSMTSSRRARRPARPSRASHSTINRRSSTPRRARAPRPRHVLRSTKTSRVVRRSRNGPTTSRRARSTSNRNAPFASSTSRRTRSSPRPSSPPCSSSHSCYASTCRRCR